MKKQSLIILVILLSITIATAYQEGQMFTQSQVNGLNLNNLDYTTLKFTLLNDTQLSNEAILLHIEYLTLSEQEHPVYPYIIKKEGVMIPIPFSEENITWCENNQATCEIYVKSWGQRNANDILNSLKSKIRGYQHKGILIKFTDWIRSIFNL